MCFSYKLKLPVFSQLLKAEQLRRCPVSCPRKAALAAFIPAHTTVLTPTQRISLPRSPS